MNRQQAGLLGSVGLGAGLGAGLMYLLDPQSGRRRRAVAKDKAVSAMKQGGTALGKKSRHLGNRGKGLVLEATSKLRNRNGNGHPEEIQELTDETAGAQEDGASASLLRRAWAPALCTAATAGLAWAGLKNRDKLSSALSTALFLRDLSHRPERDRDEPETDGDTLFLIEVEEVVAVPVL
ncbi:MAG TPA: hypothetical protein VJ725_14080 [Thermoanaerobaculia bacterium]|nr:hypothetical protein [Thermoanaerobaculia bacterium]